MNGINPFIIIVDKTGDVVDTMSDKSSTDDILIVLQGYNKKYSEYAPHLALEWKDGYFAKITDYRPTISELRHEARERKLKELGFEDLTEDQLANIQLGRNLT